MNMLLRSATLALFLGFGVSLMAQDAATLPRPDRITTAAPVPKKSPMNSASMLTDGGYARIVYSQPMLRGRQMLGDQNQFGKVWRVGANEATELFTTADMRIGEVLLPAGAYSIFAIPEAEKWTVIFNAALGEWGAYSYDEGKDVARVEVPVIQDDNSYEAFTIFFEDSKLNMVWGTTKVMLPIAFVDEKPKARVEKE